MSIDWFRWYHGSVSDPKFTLIARKSNQPRSLVIAVWASLLEYASTASDRGSLADMEPDTIAACLDTDDEAVARIIEMMITKGLIKEGRIAAWESRQVFREDDSRERVRRHRERVRTANASVTHGNAKIVTVTHGNASEEEADTDTEADTEKESPKQGAVGGNQEREAAQAHPRTLEPPISPVIVSPAPKAAKAPKPVKVIKFTIPADWTPADATYALLEKRGIDRPFAEGCLDEFRLYWTERQEQRPGWEATFLNNVKRQWEHRSTQIPTPHNGKPHPNGHRHPKAPALYRHPDADRFDAILQNLNRPILEGEVVHEIH